MDTRDFAEFTGVMAAYARTRLHASPADDNELRPELEQNGSPGSFYLLTPEREKLADVTSN